MKVEFFTPSTFGDCDIRPDKYIRSIIKTSDGSIWSGGYYNLKQIDFNRKNIRAYPGLSGITDIKEKDAQHMWIGTPQDCICWTKKPASISVYRCR